MKNTFQGYKFILLHEDGPIINRLRRISDHRESSRRRKRYELGSF